MNKDQFVHYLVCEYEFEDIQEAWHYHCENCSIDDKSWIRRKWIRARKGPARGYFKFTCLSYTYLRSQHLMLSPGQVIDFSNYRANVVSIL